MPTRATKRGEERTPLTGSHDVLICGASFAGLAVARELAGSGADVLIVDRYEIGERQTSACGIPTEWLEQLGLMGAERQRFDTLVIHTPHGDARYRLPWTFSTFDYREMCGLLWEQCDAPLRDRQGRRPRRRRPTATGRSRSRPTAARSPRRWSSTRSAGAACWPSATASSRPTRRSRAGSRCTRRAAREDLEIWIDRRYVPAGYGWSFPAGDETRIGVGSFDPRFHVRRRPSCWPRTSSATGSATRATGSPTSCAGRPSAASSSSATRPATACR